MTIIPSRPVKADVAFTPSDKERGSPCPLNEHIRKIDGASFYELVTGQADALAELFSVLPKVIENRTTELSLPFKKFTSEDLTILGENFKLAYEPKGKVS